MRLFDFVLLAGAAIVGVLATAVYGMLALPQGYFRAARACAWGAALIFATLGILWAIETDSVFWIRALTVGVLGAVAAIGLTEALRQIAHLEDHGSKIAQQPTAPGATLFVECRPASPPVTVPPNGLIYWIPMWPVLSEKTSGGMIELSMLKPGEPYHFTQHEGLASLYECRITNYAQAPVFAVELTLDLRYREPVKSPNEIRPGKTTLERSWPFQIPKIDAGASNPFVFYLVNQFPLFIDVTMPKEATLRPLGATEAQRSTLTFNSVVPIILFPGQAPAPPPAPPKAD
jgi:hypothetical protein